MLLVLIRVFFLITVTNPKLDQQHQTLIPPNLPAHGSFGFSGSLLRIAAGEESKLRTRLLKVCCCFFPPVLVFRFGFVAVELLVFSCF